MKEVTPLMKTPKKKLIEVALPLEAINVASAREKSIRHGHPSTLHLWWARRPLAAARAVIFAQMVDDPSGYVDTLLGDPATRRAAERDLKKRLQLWGARVAAFEAATGGEAVAVPEAGPEPTLEEAAADIERQRLFRIIEDLVKWENTTNEVVLDRARAEIWQSWRRACVENIDHPRARELFDRHKLPAFHDPFAGGGALPLEAQRLGLEAHASDLNPVAVLINKAMIEIPPKFAGQPPVNPAAREEAKHGQLRAWRGAQGLAEDVRYYGQWMRGEAEKRIGHLYPQMEITAEMVAERPDLKKYEGRKLTVIAWLWARTVKSPNPAFANVDVPLASTFMLSTKPGKEAYVEPVILGARASSPQAGETPALPAYRFTVKVGKPKDAEAAKNGTKLSRGANFKCVMSDAPIASNHIYSEANAGRMGARLMAIVAEGERGRVYLSPTPEMEAIALMAQPVWKPEVAMPENPRWFSPPLYGLKTYGDLFTPRQLVALTTFSDLVQEAREKVKADALGARASRPHLPQTEWHSRGYLPHWEAGERPQSITFRLADSLPSALLGQWREELARLPEAGAARERRIRIEAALDRGHGEASLKDPAIAAMVEGALLHFDGTRYRLHAWIIMPTHVHVLATPLHGHTLSGILHSWKSFTAKAANAALGREGAFWAPEYFDRVIRDERHFAAAKDYIEQNPVAAGLCALASQWAFSSAAGNAGILPANGRTGRPRSQDDLPLSEGGAGAQAYADAVAVYLAFVVSRLADFNSTVCGWIPVVQATRNTFARQAIPMTWDYAELNVFGEWLANYGAALEKIVKAQEISFPTQYASDRLSTSSQADASTQSTSRDRVVSTDPPYYDNIGYADLSDFFYVWLRRSLQPVFPDLFTTLAVPKAEELVATPYRHGSKEKAEAFFLDGMTAAMHRLAEQTHPGFPTTIYYAYKQSETDGQDGTKNTGWDVFLEAVIDAGFAVSGTWPMRTELANRMIGSGTNALASSIILVCRPRSATAVTATRREFLNALKAELPAALAHLQRGNIAPVDLAQASIGPGMAVYTRYANVMDAEGKSLSVREALALINQTLDEVLAEQEGDFDAGSRWALAWFEQYGFAEGEFGVADVLARAKVTAVTGLVEAGIVSSKAGKVRLLKPAELPENWDPATDTRLTVWEMVHHLIRVLDAGGENAAAMLLAKLGVKAEVARELCYRLYTLCERKKRAAEALAYNSLVQSWPEISRLAREGDQPPPAQAALDV